MHWAKTCSHKSDYVVHVTESVYGVEDKTVVTKKLRLY